MEVGPRMTGRSVCSTGASARHRDVSGPALGARPPARGKPQPLTGAGRQGGGRPHVTAVQGAHGHLVVCAGLQVTKPHGPLSRAQLLLLRGAAWRGAQRGQCG